MGSDEDAGGRTETALSSFFFFLLDFNELAWNLRQDTLWALLPHCVMGKGKGKNAFLKEKQELALNNGHIEC